MVKIRTTTFDFAAISSVQTQTEQMTDLVRFLTLPVGHLNHVSARMRRGLQKHLMLNNFEN